MMTGKSYIAATILLALATVGLADEVQPTTMRLHEVVQREVNRRAIGGIRVEGNKTFSSDSIRNALLVNDAIHNFLWPKNPGDDAWTGTTSDEYATALQQQIMAGYHGAGFLDANIVVTFVDTTQPATVVVDEGPSFTTGDILIDGVTDEVTDGIRHALQNSRSTESVSSVIRQLIISHETQEAVWLQNKAASTSTRKQQQAVECVAGYMNGQGFGFAKSSVNFLRDDERHVVKLHIVVTPQEQNRIGEIQFSGLQKYSEADVQKIIDVKVGTLASPELCRKIEATLTGSGRFLFAKCDTQTPFGPEQPVALHIRVREYEEVQPGDEFSKIQQAILRYGQWLADWQTDGPDFIFEAQVDVAKCLTALRGNADEQILSMSNQLLSSLRQAELRLVVSPTDGAVLTLKAKDADGNFKLNHSFLHCRDLFGVVSHGSKRSWIMDGSSGIKLPTFHPQFAMQGVDPNESERRLHLRLGFGGRSDGKAPIEAHITVEATALLCGLTSRTESSGKSIQWAPPCIKVNSDGREVVQSQGALFACEIDVETGQLLSAAADFDAGECAIRFRRGQLQSDLDKLRESFKTAKNFAESGTCVKSAISFMATEINELCNAKDQPLLTFTAKMLNDAKIQNAVEVMMTDIETRHSFHIPNTKPDTTKVGSTVAILYSLTPADSAIGRVILAMAGAVSRRSGALLTSLSFDAMVSDRYGPVSCAGLAYLFRQMNFEDFAKTFAVLGHRRLEAEGLIREFEGYLAPTALTGAIAHHFVHNLQQLDDEEFERRIVAMDQITLNHGQRIIKLGDLPLRMALTTLRSHQSHDPKVVLRDGLTLLCASQTTKIDEFLAAQMLPPEKPIRFFRSASSTKAKDILKDKKAPNVSRPETDVSTDRGVR